MYFEVKVSTKNTIFTVTKAIFLNLLLKQRPTIINSYIFVSEIINQLP